MLAGARSSAWPQRRPQRWAGCWGGRWWGGPLCCCWWGLSAMETVWLCVAIQHLGKTCINSRIQSCCIEHLWRHCVHVSQSSDDQKKCRCILIVARLSGLILSFKSMAPLSGSRSSLGSGKSGWFLTCFCTSPRLPRKDPQPTFTAFNSDARMYQLQCCKDTTAAAHH